MSSAAPGARIHADGDGRRRQRLADARERPSALLLIDLQNDFCHPEGTFARAGFTVPDMATVSTTVNRLLAAARDAGRPVVWTTTTWSSSADAGLLARRSPFLADEGLRPGWGSEMLAELDVRTGEDTFVTKRRFSAFYETEMHATLAGLGVGTLVVAGVRTDFCVESTVRDAFFRDYDVLVVADAVAGYVPELHEHSLRLMNTVFAQVVDAADAEALFAPAR